MKYIRLLIFILTTSFIPVHATNIGGVLFSNTTLDSTNNPYFVTSDLQVPVGIELSIGPGVVMYFSEGVSIKTGGLLRMEGTALHPIELSPDSISAYWGGMFFYDSAIDFDTTTQTGCFVNHIHSVKGGGAIGLDLYGFGNGYVIKTILATVAITNSIFENTIGAGFLFTQGGYFRYNEVFGIDFNMDHVFGDNNNMYFENNYIHNITAPNVSAVFTTGKCIIKGNIFQNCNNYDAVLRVSDDCIISDNQIINCETAWGIALLGGFNHTIERNLLDNNKRHIVQCCERYPVVNNNCFGSFDDYAIFISANVNLFYPFGTYDCAPFNGITTIDYSNNYFLGADSTSINDIIFDYYDDIGDLLICNTLPLNSTCIYGPMSNENIENMVFSIFPNPTNRYLHVQLDKGVEASDYKVDLINQMGQTIYSNKLIDGFLQMDVSGLSSGIYNLVIYDTRNNLHKSEKIIISH